MIHLQSTRRCRMPRTTAVCVILLVWILDPAGVLAQQVQGNLPDPAESGENDRRERRLGLRLGLSNTFDTNIEHDDEDLDSYGLVPSAVVSLRDRTRKPRAMLEYEIARHSYSNTERWDRVSHRIRSAFESKASDRIYLALDAEVSLGGTSEDRDVSNEYSVQPQIEYRLTRVVRVHAYGTLREKRDRDDPTDDSSKPNVGFVLELKGSRVGLDLEARRERNREQIDRGNYDRSTFSGELELPFIGRGGQLEIEVKHRQKDYLARFVEVDNDDVLRADRRWILQGGWLLPVGRSAAIEARYEYEKRRSNDPDKVYLAHQFGLGFVWAFGAR